MRSGPDSSRPLGGNARIWTRPRSGPTWCTGHGLRVDAGHERSFSGSAPGKAVDVDATGALLVDTDDGEKRVTEGDCEKLRRDYAGSAAGGATALWLLELSLPAVSLPEDSVMPAFCSSSQLWYSCWETTSIFPSIAEWPTPQYSAQ